MEVREPSAKYLAKPACKQTEVGVIPEDWHTAVLDSLGKPGRPAVKAGPFGTALKKATYVAEGYKIYGQEQVIRGDYLYGDYYITKATFNDLKSCSVEAGDILLSLVGTAGRVLVVPPDAPKGIINPRLIRFSFDTTRISPIFLKFQLESSVYQSLLARTAQGGTMGVLNAGLLRPIQVPLPDLHEQQAIAEALSDADALIEALEQLLAKKRQIKQGAMQELLTGQKRLPGFAGEWEVRSLIELAGGRKELFDDGDWIESEHLTTEGVRLIQTGNIGVERFLDKDERKYVYESSFVSLGCKEVIPGDLLVCRLAEPAGRACVLPNIGEAKMITSVDVTIFRPPELVANRVFLANVFSTLEWFQAVSDRSGGTTHKRIARGALGRIKIKIPPISEQTAIAALLSDMDAEIAALEAKLGKARGVKQGMMQELLTGRIRLV
jgi:type I restriction enzyme S subunit